MTDTLDPPLEGTDAPDPPAQLGHLGHRRVLLRPAPQKIGVSRGLDLTWKAAEVAAGTGGVTAQISHENNAGFVRFALPADLGWVRLNVALDRDAATMPTTMPTKPPTLLMLRALLRINGPDAPVLRPSLSRVRRSSGVATIIDSTAATLPLATPGWHLIEAHMLCAPDSDTHQTGLILRLPEDATVDLGPVQTAWFAAGPVTGDLATTMADQEAHAIRPFTARPVSMPEASEALAAPFVISAGLTGSALTGTVMAEGATEVILRLGNAEQTVPLGPDRGAEVPLTKDLSVPYGFTVPLVALLAQTSHPAAEVTCHLPQSGGLSAPIARIPVPPAYAALHPETESTKGPASDATNTDGPLPPITLFHDPPQSGPDPYRKLLYRAMTEADTHPGDLDAAIHRQEVQGASPVVLHLHGIAHVLAAAQDLAEAEALRRRYTDRMRYFVHLGGTVVWTIDGPLPEQTRFANVWKSLGQDIADLARILHVHSKTAQGRVTALWQIRPDRILVAAHPSYLDHYPGYVSRSDARARMGLAADAGPVFLLQGRLSPNKGIDDLIAAFADLRKTRPGAWLVIMGEPEAPLRKGVLTRSYGALPNIRVIETTVADTTLQWHYRAADWAVLPYREVITPKALICAMSFGLPVIAPDIGAIPDLITPGATGLLYTPDASNPSGPLATTLAKACTLTSAETLAMGEAALDAMRPRTRSALAQSLTTAIRQAWPSQTVQIAFDDQPRDVQLLGAIFPPRQVARTAVIILNYGHAEDTARLIDTLYAGTETDFDVYVVDNCSPNLSACDLATLFPQAHVLRLPENLGYAAGNNAALRLIADLAYEFVWILNPDMVVPPEALDQHIAAASAHPQRGIFGPALLRGDPAGRLASAGCYVSLSDGLATGHLYAGELPEVLPTAPYEADFVTGAAVFLRATTLKQIGTIPEEFFLYFEETAWLRRAAAKGHTALVLPHIRLAHHKRSEDGDLPAPYFYYYYIRNALIFAAQMGTPADVAATAARLRSDFIAAWTARISRTRPDRLAVYDLLAKMSLADGLAGKTGPVDLTALELMASGLPAPDAPAPNPEELASCTAIIDPQGLLVGQIALTAETAKQPCTITALLDGRIVGHMVASAVQPTILLGTAHLHSFELTLPDGGRNGRGHRLEFYVNGHAARTGSAALLRFLDRPAPALAGGIDSIAGHVCHGWLIDRTDPDTPVMAEILHQDRVIGRGLAGRSHADRPTGGFAIRLPRRFADGDAHMLSLRLAGQAVPLTHSSLCDSAFDTRVFEGTTNPATAAPQTALTAMAYGQTLWFGAHDPATLPITRYMQATAQALTTAAQTDPSPEAPLVSVILPVHNDAAGVLRAIRSVQAQSYTMWELIVIDDASTDGTRERVTAHFGPQGDSRIKQIDRATQGGGAMARNAGLARAQGEVIAWLDSDDHWDPAYLSVMVAALTQGAAGRDGKGAQPTPDAAPDAVYCGTWLAQNDPEAAINSTQEVIGLRLPPPALALIENDDVIALSSLVHRRHLTDRLGGLDANLVRFSGWDLVARISAVAVPHPVGAALVTRTLSTGSLSDSHPDGPALGQINTRMARRGTPQTDALDVADHAPTTEPPLHDPDTQGPAPKPATPALPRTLDPGRPVDVVLRAPGATDAAALRRRIDAVALTLRPEAGHRLIVQTSAAMTAALGILNGVYLNGADLLLRQIPGGPNQLDGLRDALACRRRAAHLAILEPTALVQSGWLEALSHAQTRVPQAGMLLPRHVLPGRHGAVRRHAPATRPERDACVTVSAQMGNLLDPLLYARDGLMSLTGFDPFCTYIAADVASLLPLPGNSAGPDHKTLLGEWADFTRLHLHRPLVYCPRAQAFDMGL